VANQSSSEISDIRHERIVLRRPPSGDTARLVDLELLSQAMVSGELAAEISAANDDPELAN
jgi:hypothetical protein